MFTPPLTEQRLSRVDGADKVTGRALYAGDVTATGLVHAVLVQSTIARGTIAAIDWREAERSAGVVKIYARTNLPPLVPPPEDFTSDFPAERRAPLSDDIVHYAGQHVAIVLAETLEQAQAAAAMVRMTYVAAEPILELRDDNPGIYKPDHFATNSEEKLQSSRGERDGAAFRIQRTYLTPVVHHNPMEPYATVAEWDGDRLTLHDSTRWVQGSRKIVAHMLGLPEQNVRVIAPFVGGAFGSKGFLWQHVSLAAQAARAAGRPVKLVLTRQQMFTSIGHRPRTRQDLELGADKDGALTAVVHRTLTETSPVAHFVEPAGMTSRNLYRTPYAAISHAVAPTNIATPCFMRAPGESPGMFALESAIDEMASQAGLDPLEFRLRNYAERDLQTDRPWSSKHLRECYREGAERFGWQRRLAAPASMRKGDKLIGWGMATAAYPGRRSPATVRATLGRDGIAVFSAATHEIGGGTATVMERVASETLRFPMAQVRFELGDSSFPQAPIAGASQTVSSVGPAVQEAAQQLRAALLRVVVADEESVFHGENPADLGIEDGVLFDSRDRHRSESLSASLARMKSPQLSVEASAKLEDAVRKQHTFHSFGVHFAEVEVDRDFGEVRVKRWVSVIDGGRILNPKTARSQIMGGVIFGLGMALLEETVYDRHSGAPINADLAEYLLPTCADAPQFDIAFLEYPDYTFDPLGIRGIGEIGITGVPAAIANAVYHATGIRVRSLPISPNKLIGA